LIDDLPRLLAQTMTACLPWGARVARRYKTLSGTTVDSATTVDTGDEWGMGERRDPLNDNCS